MSDNSNQQNDIVQLLSEMRNSGKHKQPDGVALLLWLLVVTDYNFQHQGGVGYTRQDRADLATKLNVDVALVDSFLDIPAQSGNANCYATVALTFTKLMSDCGYGHPDCPHNPHSELASLIASVN